jgi:iron complex transport system ATP-binding protein
LSKQIKISSLTVGYNKPILNNICLTTKNNQLISVFGRNGKGKSTLLRTLSGILPPINGSFMFNDIDILNLSEKERSKILSIVSATQTDIGGIKVKDFVAFGRYPYTNWLGINKELDYSEIDKAIELCSLNSLANRNYIELSDGEKQKVNIARAISQNTPIIILDEPTAHLDLINTIEVLKLLNELVKNHSKTIIISTHQIEYALQICNEIWLINNNQVETYTPNEIIHEEKLKELYNDELVSFDKISKTFKLI